ncbi:MAG: hypothetical protein ABJM43_09410 [Paracoccaceae bacterium]
MKNLNNPKTRTLSQNILNILEKEPIPKSIIIDWQLEKLISTGEIVAKFVSGKVKDSKSTQLAYTTLKLEIEKLGNDLSEGESGSASARRGRRSRKLGKCFRQANRAHDRCIEDALEGPLPESDGPGTHWTDDPAFHCTMELLHALADCGRDHGTPIS